MKERITITIDKELLGWIDSNVKTSDFANRSHCLEFLIKSKMASEIEPEMDFGKKESER